MLANELHRRLTFHAEDRVHWLGPAGVLPRTTSPALAWLNAAVAPPRSRLQLSLAAAVTAVIGLLRCLALRWILRPSAQPDHPDA
ncbi:hypothetical protein E4P39_01390 [Blastococcus sp. CT_GayMR19]|uniref:hypothetical protein n=1 Tax=Blastococcus sp. CT_GayMR19 TaxID=2559608 RepID=UPI00107327D6|nr:hypothetical protein [Blastococcus sp. CT_GayMR19]TFV79328.1 hypothetical protein E4P39_01390 [Blastococcus sp. CT_GayMR19]